MRTALALLVLVPTLAFHGPAQADDPSVRAVNGAAHVYRFTDDGYRVELNVFGRRMARVGDVSTGAVVDPIEVCVRATRTVRTGDTTVTREQAGCVPGGTLTFDAVAWTARLGGSASVDVWEQTVVDRGPGRTSVRERFWRDEVRFALNWIGREPTALGYDLRPPGVGGGYRPVSPPGAGAWVWRHANVTGRIRFVGLGLLADVPPGHRGTLAWS